MAFFDRTAWDWIDRADPTTRPTNSSQASTAFFDRTAGDWIVWTGTRWISWSTPSGPGFYSLRSADEPSSSSHEPPVAPCRPVICEPCVVQPRKLTFDCDICGESFRKQEIRPTKALLTITEPDGTFRQFTDERTVCIPCVWKEFKVFPPLHKR